jgi:hypothetical protein
MLQELYAETAASQKLVDDVYRDRTKLEADDIARAGTGPVFFDEELALKYGFIQGVAELRIPRGAKHVVVNVNANIVSKGPEIPSAQPATVEPAAATMKSVVAPNDAHAASGEEV